MACSILEPISWEAAATIITGILAVGAAIWVGHRQARILKQQNTIANEMRAIESLKIKSELFDRRFAVYQATLEWFMEFIKENKMPTGAVATAFEKACVNAVFLFEPEVAESLNNWNRAALSHRLNTNRYLKCSDERRAVYEQKIDDAEKILSEADIVTLFKSRLDLSQVS